MVGLLRLFPYEPTRWDVVLEEPGRSRHDPSVASIATLARTVRRLPTAEEVRCVFDNTASGAAIEDASELRQRLIVDVPAHSTAEGRPSSRQSHRAAAFGATFKAH
jgi:uncharacterized protein YecE (DUF72 family)